MSVVDLYAPIRYRQRARKETRGTTANSFIRAEHYMYERFEGTDRRPKVSALRSIPPLEKNRENTACMYTYDGPGLFFCFQLWAKNDEMNAHRETTLELKLDTGVVCA